MTEPAHLTATRATYDAVAESYARLIPGLRAEAELDRAVLATFVLAELARVLAPGGSLLVGFHAGDEHLAVTSAYGHDVRCDACRLPPERVSALLEEAGLEVQNRLVRAPEGRERSPQGSLIARRPGRRGQAPISSVPSARS